MVKQLLRKFSLLLAAMDLSDQEIAALLRHLRDQPLDVLIAQLREDRDVLLKQVKMPLPIIRSASLAEEDTSSGSDIAAQIERLLVVEARLSKAQAAQALRNALTARHPAAEVAPFASKEGFGRWLKQLIQIFPIAELLHVASAIRNSRAHGTDDDWLETKRSS
jgi:hypothetical protein